MFTSGMVILEKYNTCMSKIVNLGASEFFTSIFKNNEKKGNTLYNKK